MNHTLRKHVATAAMLLAPLGAALVAQPAAAQSHRHYRVADQGRVTNMSVNSNAGLAPGATLRLQVYATPGARWASVALGGSGVRVLGLVASQVDLLRPAATQLDRDRRGGGAEAERAQHREEAA